MLNVQKYLREKGLEKLQEEFGIKVARHDKDPLVVLNYCQIKSPERHFIADECRSLVLEDRSFDLVARGFQRFYNVSQLEDCAFNWSDFKAYSKEDGSLMVLYHYNGRWRVNTRGSFANHPMMRGSPTWADIFWTLLKVDQATLRPFIGMSLVFELCTAYNPNVSFYREPRLFLLSSFHGLQENDHKKTDDIAKVIKVERPYVERFSDKKSLYKKLEILNADNDLPEGYVLIDSKGERRKLKTESYSEFHRLLNNGALLFPKNVLPLVRLKKTESILGRFPRYTTAFRDVEEKYNQFLSDLELIWGKYKDIESQKEFAMNVKDSPVSALLFIKRKNPDKNFADLAVDSEKYIVDQLFGDIVYEPDVLSPIDAVIAEN